jgi:hypothetical protein
MELQQATRNAQPSDNRQWHRHLLHEVYWEACCSMLQKKKLLHRKPVFSACGSIMYGNKQMFSCDSTCFVSRETNTETTASLFILPLKWEQLQKYFKISISVSTQQSIKSTETPCRTCGVHCLGHDTTFRDMILLPSSDDWLTLYWHFSFLYC